MRIENLSGLFTGQGFKKKSGRKVDFKDCGFKKGPLTLSIGADGKIQSVDKTVRPTSAPVVDGTGCIALAGFVDSHTHALFIGTRAKEYFARWNGQSYRQIAAAGGGIHNTVRATSNASEAVLVDALKRNLNRSRAGGTTTIEVKSGYGQTPAGELHTLRAIKKFATSLEGKNYPHVVPTFLALHALPKAQKERAYVDSMIAILKDVAAEKLATFVDAFPEKGFFTLDESLRLIRAANEHGLAAKIHADEMSDLGSAAAFAAEKAISVDHLQKISAKGVKALAKSSTVATLLPATSFFSNLEYTDARKLIDAGVRVSLATDFNPGTAPEPSFALTHQLAAANLRMSSAEILCASTLNGAAALSLDQDRGVLLPKYRAHINLYRVSDPTDGQQSLEEIFVEGLRPWRTIIEQKVLGRV